MRGISVLKLASRQVDADVAGMSPALRNAIYVIVMVCFVVVAGRTATPVAKPPPDDGGAQYRLDAAAADAAGASLLSVQQRAATFTFAPGTTPDAERFFGSAIASARPEAQRLVGLVDGLVTVHFAPPPGRDAIGLTTFDGEEYRVYIDLSAVIARYGVREGNAIVLHELGHVVDIAIAPDELVVELDKDIPIGENCERDGPTVGACAPIEERFADSFSKWAMDDLGVNLASGYRILPPVPLEAWGRPLVRLAG